MTTKHPLPTNVVIETLREGGLIKETCVSLDYTILKSVRPSHIHTGMTKEKIEIVGVGNSKEESLAALRKNILRQRRIGR